MIPLKIGILGTRGIPNHYGGFEQFAEKLSEGLVLRGDEVSVYSSHKHPYHSDEWKGVQIIHCYDPEYLIGTASQFLYDLNCIRDSRKRKFDILLVLGYTSSSVWGWLYPKNTIVITNMDGLEWKRSKYSAWVQRFLQYAEKLAVRFSDQYVADSIPIKKYLDEKYRIDAAYISYGAVIPLQPSENLLEKYGVTRGDYFLLIARMEPENHIETILDGLCRNDQKVLVVGNTQNAFGRKMKAKFSAYPLIVFTEAIYDTAELDSLRAFCSVYFHGHSVGGTNPSLLEAMAGGALICAHDNPFNRAVLQEDAFYFYSHEDVSSVAGNKISEDKKKQMIERNLQKIREQHSWEMIIGSYEQLFFQSYQSMQ